MSSVSPIWEFGRKTVRIEDLIDGSDFVSSPSEPIFPLNSKENN
jgi:hypothetical protein